MGNLLRAVIAGCLLVGSSAAGDLEELKETFAAAVKALNARDLDGFLAAVHPNSLSFYSCGPTSGKEGKEACRADWVQFFSYSGPANFDAANFEARIVGNTGIVWGKYSLAVKQKNGTEKNYSGRFSLIYTRQDGKWMVVWQENSPAAPQPASP
jgi:uncharacterized protein (TIGR02246 family)